MNGIAKMLPRRPCLLAAVTVLGLLGSAGVASAQTYTVTTTNDSNDGACTASLCSLRDAVVAADGAGGSSTIVVGPGTYTYSIASTALNDPTNGDLDINNNASVTITGAGSSQTIINPNGIDRAFAVQTGATLTLSGMTIELGKPSRNSSGASAGGAVWADGLLDVTGDVVFNDNTTGKDGGAIFLASDQGSPNTINGATFTRNSAADAGAIYDNSADPLNITSSSFANNTSNEDGGAIYGDDGSMTISGGSFTNNDTAYGGGVYWDGASAVTVTNSSFTGNAGSWEFGGAVYDTGSTSMSLNSDTFTGNYAGYAGALYLDSSSGNYTLNGDEFDHNSATYNGGAVLWGAGTLSSTGSSLIGNIANEGGGLFTCSSDQLTLTDATISLNNASQGGGVELGGGSGCEDPPVSMINDTIAFNTAGIGQGGGVYETSAASAPSPGTPGLENTIIAKNTGGDCGDSSATSQFAASVDAGNNLDSDSSCFGGLGGSGDKTGVDPLLAQPANNGGAVLTDAELPGSPAIDAGSNANCAGTTDARGIQRPQGASCDMGAYEAAPAVLRMSKTAPANGTTNVPISYTLTINNGGPGPSSATTLVDQLPAGETLFGTNPSQGSCTSAGTPAKVTCSLGVMNPAAAATVTIVAAEANVGSVTNTATVTNDQGSSATGSATTMFTAASSAATSPPIAITGGARKLHHTSAEITGTVKTGGFGTEYFFEVGRSKSYGIVTKLKHTAATTINVSAALGGLRPGTTYHYRLVAVNSDGTAHGRDRTFKTTGQLGKLVLDSLHLTASNGLVAAPLTCDSSLACHGLFSITTDSDVGGHTATVVCTVSHSTNYKIGAGKNDTIHAQLTLACLNLLEAAPGHTITAKFSSRARSGQYGVIKIITLSLG